MAVDTAHKRFSMISFGSPSSDMVFEPDGTVDTDDKALLLDLYSGIAATIAWTATMMKSLTLQLGGGIGKTLGLKGNVLPITVTTVVPSGEPAGGQGVAFYISGGVLTVYAWDPATSAWVS